MMRLELGTTQMKILIIDDEKPTLQMLSMFLEACGYEVFTAENESQGVSQFKETQPAVVLTDIKMPGKDGFAALSQIKAIAPRTEVIVITGHGDKDLARQAKDLGASAFFNKPLDTEALDRTIKEIEARFAQNGPSPNSSR
jgi:YesN/AraC family two-component response regulator